jgi:hypothetical protein
MDLKRADLFLGGKGVECLGNLHGRCGPIWTGVDKIERGELKWVVKS